MIFFYKNALQEKKSHTVTKIKYFENIIFIETLAGYERNVVLFGKVKIIQFGIFVSKAKYVD